MKILNLYAGIGGNRKLWGSEHQITSVENNPEIAGVYRRLFPQDDCIVADAHQFLLDHHREFDFIWSSPPCPTHSKASTSLYGWNVVRYPDMALYQEIIFLKHFFKGLWVVENVQPYYQPLIAPTANLDRHLFWSNFAIAPMHVVRDYNVARTTKEMLSDHLGIQLPAGTKDQRKLLRNAVYPQLGAHVLCCATESQPEVLRDAGLFLSSLASRALRYRALPDYRQRLSPRHFGNRQNDVPS